MIPDSVAAILRYALIAAGTWVATKYGITDLNVEGLAGAVLTVLTVIWGVFVKKGTVAIPADSIKTTQSPVSSITGTQG